MTKKQTARGRLGAGKTTGIEHCPSARMAASRVGMSFILLVRYLLFPRERSIWLVQTATMMRNCWLRCVGAETQFH